MFFTVLLGFVLGFFGSVPVAGPVSALVLRRGLEGRVRSGGFVALGAGLAEGLYALLAFWGFAELVEGNPKVAVGSLAATAAILFALGVSFFSTKTKTGETYKGYDSRRKGFLLGFTVAVFNPTLIVVWAAVVTILFDLQLIEFTPRLAIPFGIGCCLGIAAWFILLLRIVQHGRKRFSEAGMKRFMRAMGVFLIGLSLWFGYRVVRLLRHPKTAHAAAASASATSVPAPPVPTTAPSSGR
jgi:threonine/homoserine/homoserine lactone efflux protein